MSKELETLEMLKNMALSDLDSIPITAITICEKFNEEPNRETCVECKARWLNKKVDY